MKPFHHDRICEVSNCCESFALDWQGWEVVFVAMPLSIFQYFSSAINLWKFMKLNRQGIVDVHLELKSMNWFQL